MESTLYVCVLQRICSLYNIHMCIVYTYIQIYIVYTQTHIQDYKHNNVAVSLRELHSFCMLTLKRFKKKVKQYVYVYKYLTKPKTKKFEKNILSCCRPM